MSYLSRLTLRMVPTDSDPSWHVEKVEVAPETNPDDVSVFNFSKWLDKANPSAVVYRYNSLTKYSVAVTTADASDAAFDGELYIVLHGVWGSTEEVQLVNSSTVLTPGSVEGYEVSLGDVGLLIKADVRVVASGKEVKWGMARIEVTNQSSGKTFAFVKDVCIEPGSTFSVPRDMPPAEYKLVVVTTADVADGGFDGDVYVTLFGAEGQTEEVKLALPVAGASDAGVAAVGNAAGPAAAPTGNAAADGAPAASDAAASDPNKAPKFEVGSSQVFVLKMGDVGPISYATVRMDPATGSAAAAGEEVKWHLARLEVTNSSSGAAAVLPYRSYITSWSPMAYCYPQASYCYEVEVETADVRGAGTEGDVFITLANQWCVMTGVMCCCGMAVRGTHVLCMCVCGACVRWQCLQ